MPTNQRDTDARDVIKARFLSRVQMSDEPDGCHLWTAATTADGYGMVWHDGRPQTAHRLAYLLFRGAIPAGKIIRHRCLNPPCVRVSHLVPGTRAEVMDDRLTRMAISTADAWTESSIPGVLAFIDAGWDPRDAARAMSVRLDTFNKWLRQGLREREAAAGLTGVAA